MIGKVIVGSIIARLIFIIIILLAILFLWISLWGFPCWLFTGEESSNYIIRKTIEWCAK